jgi:hypothetical protein
MAEIFDINLIVRTGRRATAVQLALCGLVEASLGANKRCPGRPKIARRILFFLLRARFSRQGGING